MLAAPRRALLALMLAVLTLVSGGCVSKAGQPPPPGGASNLNATAPSGALQEVAPPGAVQQLNERLNERSPQVRVLQPADNALLPTGPWTLQLQVSDWPLADAGSLGLGPHLVVQLDDQEPLRITSHEAATSVAMPDLRPGSHRVTVYAARPWGEAVKAPGASAQVRIHRVARNAAELPANNSAQLITTSPDGLQQVEPVLVDWLLLNAPLQNLRGDDARWRLRISVNGDSFLVDRQTPVWLKGFKRGSNAVQLELLDGRGEPLNPPFNSLVREVVIGSGTRPAWLRTNLSAAELSILSGEQPAPPANGEAEPEQEAEPAQVVTPDPEPTPDPIVETAFPATPAEPQEEPAEGLEVEAETPRDPGPIETTENAASSDEDPSLPATALDKPADPSERLSPQTNLSGSAREQVNADGSLQKPTTRGPLAGLREKLGG